MGRKRRVWLTVLLAALAGGLGWQTARSNNRLFQGKPEAVWISSLTNGYTHEEFARWQALGPDAVPILIKALRRGGTGPIQRAYLMVLSNLPSTVAGKIAEKPPKPHEYVDLRVQAAALLGELGIDLQISVPALARALRDDEINVQLAAIGAMEGLLGSGSVPSEEKAEIARSLVRSLQDKSGSVRLNVISALRGCKDQPELVTPALVTALKDSDSATRNNAARSLIQVDPQAAAKQDPAVMVGCLMDGLHSKFAVNRTQSVRALVDFAPAARAAIPVLKRTLDDENAEVREAATNALKQIDPDSQEQDR